MAQFPPNWRCQCGAVNFGHPEHCWRCNGRKDAHAVNPFMTEAKEAPKP